MKKEMLSGLCGLGVSLVIAAPATTNDLYVGASYTADGSTYFTTVQAAFDAVSASSEAATVIHLASGTYSEAVTVSNAVHDVLLVGDERNPASYVICGENDNGGALWLNAAITNFEARGVTLINAAWQDYIDGNREYPGIKRALRISTGSNPCVFRHCRIISGQDTLYINGGQGYFEDCYIEGDTDFIYGEACALFNRCELHAHSGYFTADGHGNNNTGYVNIGYLFWKCRFTVDSGASAYLGRAWRNGANVWLADCYIGPGVRPELWMYWNDVKGKTVLRDYGTRSDTTFSPPNNKGQWGEGVIVRGTLDDFWTAMAGFGYTSITDVFGQEAGDWRPEVRPAIEVR